MRTSVQALAVLAVLTLVPATDAMAQATRTWVSGVGDDANPCSRTAPCKTFAGTISKTAAGGEINVLDPGGFGQVTITKSITIRSDSIEAGILVASGSGIVINAATTDRVVLDGLDFDGLGSVGASTFGVNILQARDVVVRNSSIRGFLSAGIQVNSANQSSLVVENCLFFNNAVGILVASSGGNGTARVYNSQITVSSAAGIRVSGTGNRAEISNNQIIRTPLSLDLVSGGAIDSYGDNVLSTGDLPNIVQKG
jgi:hypothetical protein